MLGSPYLAIILVLMWIINQRTGNYGYSVVWMNFSNKLFTPYGVAFLGIFFWLKLSNILDKFIGKNKIVRYIGENSWDIMTHHLFVFFLINLGWKTIHQYGFNNESFKSDIWYNFTPSSHYQTLFYYMLAISIPLCLRYVINITPRFFSYIKIKKQ